jgi:hypothetical protein
MMVRMARSKSLQGQKKSQLQERLRIVRSLLDMIADDRLLVERIGLRGVFVQPLSEAEVRGL